MSERTCSIEGCPKTHYGRGWCSAHYSRWRVHGSPTGGGEGRIDAYTPDDACAVDGCDERPRSRGWCRNHYYRWKNFGSPTAGPPMRSRNATVEERFWSKVNKDGPIPEHRPELGPCWVWTRSKVQGYGAFGLNGRTERAHCLAYLWLVGPVATGLELDHLCRNRACVRHSHLEAVPHQINILRGISPAAINAVKTECANGHPFDDENTYVDAIGRRGCRECNRERLRRYHGYYKK